MARQPIITAITTDQLRVNDIVVTIDDKNKVTDWTQLKKEIAPISCRGRHFEAKGAKGGTHHVCYLPGKVKVAK
jgi:hypothetical protein